MIRSWLFGAAVALLAASGGGMPAAWAAETYLLQLASMTSEDAAKAEWARLQRRHPDLLGDMAPRYQTADLADKGTVVRIRIGPFPTRATAEDMCLQLRGEKQDCLVVKRAP